MSQFSVPWQPRRQAEFGFFGRMIASIAIFIANVAKATILRSPGMLLIGAVVVVCFGVWAHALLFHFVDTVILANAAAAFGSSASTEPSFFSPSTWGLTPTQIGFLMQEHGGGVAASASGLGKYLLWPVQFGIVRDFIGVGALIGLFNIIPIYTIWWERKVAGHIQSRLGPMRVGGWHGWAQSFADGIKLVFKEDLIPAGADAPLFRIAPYLNIIPTAVALLALPFGAVYLFRELDTALIFILGVLGVEVVGVILAGWGSNNKWSVYGAMREACQMVSYEIPMGMALVVPVVIVGSLNLKTIGEYQSGGWFSWIVFQSPFAFAAFLCYFVASLASCKRAPFDLPEAESELVAGFLTEYSGIRWSFFFFAEYVAMFIVSGLAVIMFMGGWHSPLPASLGDSLGDAWYMNGVKGLLFSSPVWFVAKCVFFLYVQIWIRWTLPRIRIDQVLYGCVQVMLPATMLLLFGTVLWVWAADAGSAGWNMFDNVVTWILGAIGIFFAVAFPVIATYGFINRRNMVGNLAVDALPGS